MSCFNWLDGGAFEYVERAMMGRAANGLKRARLLNWRRSDIESEKEIKT